MMPRPLACYDTLMVNASQFFMDWPTSANRLHSTVAKKGEYSIVEMKKEAVQHARSVRVLVHAKVAALFLLLSALTSFLNVFMVIS